MWLSIVGMGDGVWGVEREILYPWSTFLKHGDVSAHDHRDAPPVMITAMVDCYALCLLYSRKIRQVSSGFGELLLWSGAFRLGPVPRLIPESWVSQPE